MEADCPTIAMDTRAKVVLVAKTTEGVAGVKKTTGDEASPSQSNLKHGCWNPGILLNDLLCDMLQLVFILC